MTKTRKKLIEVALPLEAINEGSKPETENPFLKGHPRAIHNWWARTPLSVCRAVLFAQLVDDPGDGLAPDEADKARAPLLDLLRRLSTWDATTDTRLLAEARDVIKQQFDGRPPAVWDMFAGRGSISIEAQRLGLRVYSSDLNPVAVTIQKALLEYPQKFSGLPPVNPESQRKRSKGAHWHGKAAEGIMEDIAAYGGWVREEAIKRIGHLYPRADVPGSGHATVIAWLWARTVKSPNPAFRNVDVPLASTFMLSTKAGKEAYVEPVIENGGYRFTVRVGKPQNAEAAKAGTKLSRGANFRCIMSGAPIEPNHIYTEANAGCMGARLMAIVAEGDRGRVYLSPTSEHEEIATKAKPAWQPDVAMPDNPRWFSPPLYGLKTFGDLFTPRQLVALTTFSDLIGEARDRVVKDAQASGFDQKMAQLYADAITTYLACALSRMTDYHCALSTWNPINENVSHLFQRQAIPMAWDFAEANPLEGKLDFSVAARWVADSLRAIPTTCNPARVFQQDARFHTSPIDEGVAISTDPPYYDNIGYADLSDFFYVWLRRTLRRIDPETFDTVLTPKSAELIASPYRHDGSGDAAESHFREGFAAAFKGLHRVAEPSVPMTVYYAFKQSETEADENGNGATVSTGWETMLEGLINAGFAITGTWPVRTTKKARSVARNTNALASAIVIVCRERSEDAAAASRREFVNALKRELPEAVQTLQHQNIAPVDLAQAAIGPGMAIFTRYAKVVDAEGKQLSVREALALINQALDEVLAEQEGDFDADSRFAIAWFEQYGFNDGEFGVADVLARAKNTAVSGLVEAKIAVSKGGKVRLLKPQELQPDWDPATDPRLTVWEIVHHLIRALEAGGESAAASLVAKLGAKAEIARELAYRLYTIAERKKRAAEALSYNGLVQSWPEIMRLAREAAAVAGPAQAEMFA